MNESELFEAVERQLNEWAEVIGGRPWGAQLGKPRIYMASRRDVTAFFYFPDFPTGDEHELLGGAAVSVFVKDCGQHPAWYEAQRGIVRNGLRRASLALSALHCGDRQLAADIMESDIELTDELLNAVAHELVNGRVETARELLKLSSTATPSESEETR